MDLKTLPEFTTLVSDNPIIAQAQVCQTKMGLCTGFQHVMGAKKWNKKYRTAQRTKEKLQDWIQKEHKEKKM